MEEEILNLVKGNPDEFKKVLKEALEEKLTNHPAIQKAKKITRIYEQIDVLNAKVHDLLIEANSLLSEKDEPCPEEYDEDSEGISEGKMMGAKVFNFDPESVGLQKTNDNVEKMVVKDMKVLDGTEAPSSVPLFQDGPEWLEKPIVVGKPVAGNTDITSGAKLDNQTIGKTKSSQGELGREAVTGLDSTFDNVTKVRVMKSFTSDNDIRDWDIEEDEE
jgi:hypothetical protein